MQIELEKDEPYIHKCFALISLRLAYRKPRAFEPLLSLEYVHGNDESCMIKTPTLCREGNKIRVGNGEKIILTTIIMLLCQTLLVSSPHLLQHYNQILYICYTY